MREDDLVEILDAHFDSLNFEREDAQQLLKQHPNLAAELSPLLSLASSLKTILVPQDVGSFKEVLRSQLMSEPATNPLRIAIASKRPVTWGLVAAAGSFLSIVGLAIIVIRRLRAAASQKAQTAAGTA